MPCKELLHVFDFCNLGNVESTFLQVDDQAELAEPLEQDAEVNDVLFRGTAGHAQIIQVAEYKGQTADDAVHHALETAASIAEPKCHDQELE